MGQKDLAQNDYLNDKTRFADMCNGILFGGDAVIKPEELQEVSGDIVYREGERRRKIIPDMVRLWKGLYLAIISVENQTMVDYSMVFRMMKEEALSYEHQWYERDKELRRTGVLGKKTELCWYGKNEKFIPVIPIVIHTNESRYEELSYDAAQTICDIAGVDIKLIRKVNEEGREVACMCKAWDDHKESGRQEGKNIGRMEMQTECIRKLMNNLSYTLEQAMDFLEIPQSERERCMEMV